MTKTGLGSELVHGPGASSQVLGMPLGRHALSVECLKPWTVAAEHSVEDGLWTCQIRVGDSPLVRHALSVECLKTIGLCDSLTCNTHPAPRFPEA